MQPKEWMGVFDVSMCKGTLHSGKVPYIPMYGVPYVPVVPLDLSNPQDENVLVYHCFVI